jgi:hypothetical protein
VHRSVLANNPGDVFSLDALAKVQADQGNIEECVANLKKVAELTGHPRAWSAYLSYGLHVGYDLAGHQAWVDQFVTPLRKPPPHPSYDGKRQIRIGYLSNTWDRHSVSAFILPILRGHSDAVDVTLYSDIDTPEALKQAADRFVPTAAFNHFNFGTKIRSDKIDVLIELDGHKANSRLLALASNPAPVVATMNGYLPDTQFTENFNLGWAFAPYGNAPDPAPLPADRNGFVTFGSFSRAFKITLDVAKTWAAVLLAAPDSRLVVAAKGGEANTSVRARLETAGVPSKRLKLVAPHTATDDYLAALGDVDIHLDCWPFNGVSTTCDLLYQGVPSITRRTEEAQGQVGATLLSAVGLADLVATDNAGYVQIAAALAKNLDRLRELRHSLRIRMAPLLDGTALAKRIEEKCRQALADPARAARAVAAERERLDKMRAAWREIHLAAMGGRLREKLDGILKTLPCGSCAVHFKPWYDKLMAADPGDQFAVSVDAHSAVSVEIGKPAMSVEDARRIYGSAEVVDHRITDPHHRDRDS